MGDTSGTALETLWCLSLRVASVWWKPTGEPLVVLLGERGPSLKIDTLISGDWSRQVSTLPRSSEACPSWEVRQQPLGLSQGHLLATRIPGALA